MNLDIKKLGHALDASTHSRTPGVAVPASESVGPADSDPRSLSYKFQRVREQLRNAVIAGDLVGKLPGERLLSKRFNCNAKTLSKALTDLAAEGLLERTIGRGTFVRATSGGEPAAAGNGSWLVLIDERQSGSDYVEALVRAHSQLNGSGRAHVMVGAPDRRPSFLNQFSTVVDLGAVCNDELLRDLVVRGVRVLVADREPGAYSTDCVMVDRMAGAARLAGELALMGHRRVVAIEAKGSQVLTRALVSASQRLGNPFTVDTVFAEEAAATLNGQDSPVFVCDGRLNADVVSAKLAIAGAAEASVVVVGMACPEPTYSGYYVDVRSKVDAIMQLLGDSSATRRPTTLWLTPRWVERNTLRTESALAAASARAQNEAAAAGNHRTLSVAGAKSSH